MSFNFKWPTFSEEFHESAAQMLDSALNRGPKPKVIADDITVEELGMGTIPPELEILEIGDLGTDRFRGIFRLTYAGDAHLVLKTKVQANPLSKPNRTDRGLFPSSTASRGILFAAAPLVVPMHLRLSSVKLRAIVVLVVSKAKGITLVFKNDPLESVQVSSTFDSVAVIQKYLQQEIEGQLREMFREDLPGIIHRLSQRWLSGEAKHEREEAIRPEKEQQQYREAPLPIFSSDPHGNRVETASAPGGRPRSKSRSKRRPSVSASAAAVPTSKGKTPPSSPPKPRAPIRRARHSAKVASTSAAPLYNELMTSSSPVYGSAFADIEIYDPTYGLRPDELPMHSGFSGLGKLAQRISGGLRDLTSSSPEEGSAAAFTGLSGLMDDSVLGTSPDSGVDTDATDPEAEDQSSQDEVSESDQDDSEHDEEQDDVPDLDLNDPADTSIDYTRFGYPPASAAFSDTQQVNRASSIIFDDEPGPSSRKGRKSGGSSRGDASIRPPRPVRSAGSRRSKIEYETIPAVGGGTITRPRVYHIASKVQPPEVDWDEESTARPSQYGASSRTGGATRYDSDMGNTTMGAHSSRNNTVRGMSSPQIELPEFPEGSEESLMELPPESMHSSNRSQPPVLGQPFREGSSTSSVSARQSSSGQDYPRWDQSGASTAPTSHPSTGFNSTSELGMRTMPSTPSAATDENSVGIRFRKGKSAARPRPMTANSLDRAGFVAPNYGQGPGVAATPTRLSEGMRSKSMAMHVSSTSPTLSPSRRPDPDLSTSPSRDLLSSSPQPRTGLPVSGHKKNAPASLSIDASAHFADLIKSNHTLSPFTRNLEHFTVRSAPVTPGWQHGGGSVVGSAAPSSGSGGSQHGGGGSSRVSSARTAPHPLQQVESSSVSAGVQSNSPARRRRTFQLGGSPPKPEPTIKEQRRSRPDFMGPPSEAARVGAARWSSIIE